MSAFRPPTIAAPLGDVSTDRLELRRFRHDDLDEMAIVFAKPEIWQFPYGRGFTKSETAAFLDSMIEEWDQCGFGCWVAVERDTAAIVGYVGLSVPMFLPEILPAVEVGWRFDPDHWGRGLAGEGARAALREGFTTMGLAEITSVPQVGNPASSRVAESIGMRLDRKVDIPANERRGQLEGFLYRITREEWSECI